MTSIGNRVRMIRKSDKVNMTLEKFGERIGLKKNSLSQIENGVNALTDQMKLAICREFGVNQEWLETGVGEMFVQASFPELNELKRKYSLDQDAMLMIEKFIVLDPDQRKAVIDYVKSAAVSMGVHIPDPATQEDVTQEEKERAALHAALDRQIDMEKTAEEKSEVS